MPRHSRSKKEILVAVSGLTPQVITETLYYLTCKRKPSIEVSEIYAFTTKPGKELILDKLLNRKNGAFYAFCKEYGIRSSRIKFDESTIKLFKDSKGKPLSDIKTPNENTAVANTITELIRTLSSNPDTRLHCSIAGGRKTMSLYLGYSLQLFGRSDDILYHVLVPPEFEAHRDFFYIPKKHKTLTCLDAQGKTRKINTRNAEIQMAEIPYVHLRDKLTSLFGREELTYTEMVSRAQREIDSIHSLPDLELEPQKRKIKIGDKTSTLSPLGMVMLLHFAKRKLKECTAKNRGKCDGCSQCFENVIDCTSPKATKDMLNDYRDLLSEQSGMYQRLYNDWTKNGLSLERIRENISRINRAVKRLHDSHLYPISSIRMYGDTRYGIKLDKKKIRLT